MQVLAKEFPDYICCHHLYAVEDKMGALNLAQLHANPFVPNKRPGRKRGTQATKIGEDED
jgi:hypothetical protein